MLLTPDGAVQVHDCTVLNRTTVKFPDEDVWGEVQVFAREGVGNTPMSPKAKTTDTRTEIDRFDLVCNARRSERRSRMIALLLPRCLNTKALFNT
jgi:hypothetical protein